MELRQLEIFTVCVETGSFSSAARILFINQSNVSRTIQQMESELGFALFNRDTRGLSLTQSGEELYQKAKGVLFDVNEINKMAVHPCQKTFSVASFQSNYISCAFTRTYMKHHDDNKPFRAFSDTAMNIIRAVEEETASIGFVYISDSQKQRLDDILQKHDLEFTILCDAVPYLFIGAENSLAGRGNLSITEIRSLRFVKSEYDYTDLFSDLNNTIRHYGIKANINNALVVDSYSSMMQLLKHSDICYLGHMWSRSYDESLIKHDGDYTNGYQLTSFDGRIRVGYVMKKGRVKSEYISDLLSIIDETYILGA